VTPTGASWTVSGNASASGLGTLSIGGFTVNDMIDLTGFAAVSETFAGNALVLTNGGAHATLHIQGAFSSGDFHIASDGATSTDITIAPACYAAGTRILTERGEVTIERLRKGERVRTISGAMRPIVWIGHRDVDLRHHPNPRRVLPIRIAPHAFGRGLPKRALVLSPDHAVFVDDVLIPIRHLVNGSSVAVLELDAITYHHLELTRHDVVLAEGLPAETYLDAGVRNAFADGGGTMQRHSDFAPPLDRCAMLWETHGYAPLVMAGEVPERVRRRLALRAARLGIRSRLRHARAAA